MKINEEDQLRALVLFRTSNNAHGWTNWQADPERIANLCDAAREEFVRSLRSFADHVESKPYESFRTCQTGFVLSGRYRTCGHPLPCPIHSPLGDFDGREKENDDASA